MADIYGNNAILAELLVGRRSEWFKQAAPAASGAPTTVTEGVSLLGPGAEGYAPLAGVRIDLRRSIHRHEVHVDVTTVDLAVGVYRVVLGGVNADYDAAVGTPADEAALLEGIRAACDAVAGYDADLVDSTTGVPAVSPATNDSVRVYRTDGATFTADFSVTGGTGALAVQADSASATAQTYALDTGVGTDAVLTRWAKLPGFSLLTIDTDGFRDIWATPGLARVFVELTTVGVVGNGASVTDFSEIRVGPVRLESDPP